MKTKAGDPIKHVVLLMLENASCDRYLGYLSKSIYPYPQFEGIDPNAPEERFNLDYRSQKRYQRPTKLKQMRLDPMHEPKFVARQIEDNNSGFVKDLELAYPDEDSEVIDECLTHVMAYYDQGELPAHHPLAENYRPCDAWYCSVPGPTWPNRFFALSGTSNGFVNMPDGKNFWATSAMAFLEIQPTLFTELADKEVSFKVYYGDYPCSLLLWRHMGHKILHNYSKMEEFYVAAEGQADAFPEFTFIEPTYYGGDQNDDHPPHNVMKAQKLVADVYNAIRTNEELWKSTLLVVVHDEHGGFYDHMHPPKGAVNPEDKASWHESTFEQLGVRVPALLVSPFVKKGVEKTQFDHTSLLKYLKDKWELGSLGKRVDAANSVEMALDLKNCRTDCIGPIPGPTAEQLKSPYPALENEVNPNHYAADLAQKIAMHSGAVSALLEITKKHGRINSLKKVWLMLRISFWPVFAAFIAEFVKSYVARTSEMVEAEERKKRLVSIDAMIDRAKVEQAK